MTTIRDLQPDELAVAARIVARSMRDNPINVQVFGPDPARRGRSLARFFEPVLRGVRRRGSIFVAVHEATLVGVCAEAPPGSCQPSLQEKASIFPSVFAANPPATSLKVLRWTREWARRDLADTHWHLGPVAVEPRYQGQGIGAAMLAAFCERMDERAAASYLETDKAANVRFYERFGFVVLSEAQVLGVPNWFMLRRHE